MPAEYTVEEAKKVIEDLGKGFADFKKTNDQRLAEIEKSGKASAETEQKLAKLEAAVAAADEAKARIDRLETAMKRQPVEMLDSKGQRLTPEQAEYKKGLMGYLRKGHENGLAEMQTKALAVQSDPDGGYLVTPDTSGQIVTRIFETSPMRALASVQAISTDALEGIVDDDEAGAQWVGETQPRINEDTPQLGKWRIPVHEQCTRPKATQKLLDDAAVDVEAWLAGKVADRFARAEATAFVNGDGVARPRGFLNYPRVALDTYARGSIGALPGALNFDDIIEVFYGLIGSYRARATWAMNRNVLGQVRRLQDLQGQYLWEPGLQVGQPSAILGRPVAEFEDMPDAPVGQGNNSSPIALADWSTAYQIVDRLGLAVLRDPYTAKPYVEFYTRRRVGGDVLNFEAIKLLNITVP